MPHNVDVTVMCFFCEFYVAMLSFVLYRLYTGAGLHYPPKIDSVLAGQDEGSIHILHICLNILNLVLGIKAVNLERFVSKSVKKEEAPAAVAKPTPLTAAEKVISKFQHVTTLF